MSKERNLSGKVQTVLGPIAPEALGVTLMHEHILIDAGCYSTMPEEASRRAYVDAPVTIDMLGKLAGIWAVNRDNTRLYDVEQATREVMEYKLEGGCSIVDTTSIGLARDPLALARISRATGLNIIMGASYYVSLSHPADMDRRSEGHLAELIVRDLTTGVGDTGIKAGVIGEVGNTWPPIANEVKALRASVRAQQETGAPILIHPGFHPDSLPYIVDVLVKAGARMDQTIIGHLDIFDRKTLRALAKSGCYLEFDTFNNEDTSFGNPGHQTYQAPSDVQRMEKVEDLIAEGYEDRLVIAQDIFLKNQTAKYGGKGYAHILRSILPRMRKRGFTERHIRKLMVENPARVLAFR
jgi:phosphotriesterase-related protein